MSLSRRAKILLGATAGMIVLGVLTLVLLPWNKAAPMLARYATTLSGREVQIDALEVDWGWTPRLRLQGLRVANADWAGGAEKQPLAKVEAVRVAVRIWPLLRGRLELPELIVTRPQIRLEKDAKGRKNWSVAVDPGEPVKPDNRFEFPVIHQLAIEDGALVYRDVAKKVDVTTKLNTVAENDSSASTVQLEGKGSLEGKPLRIELQGASLLQLRESREPYPVSLDLKAGNTRFRASGTIDDPVRMVGADMHMKLEGRDLSEIFPLFGIPTPRTAAYSLEGQIQRERDIWKVEGLKGRIGESDLEGRLTLDEAKQQPLLTAVLTSRTLRMKDLGGFIGMDPGEAQKPAAQRSPKAIPDAEINLARLKAMDMDVTLTSDHIDASGVPIDTLNGHLDLRQGRAIIDPLSFKIAIGRLGGRAVLDARPEVPALSLALDLTNAKLKPFFAGTRFEAETEGTLGGHLEMAGSGKSFADIAGHSDGRLAVYMGGGRFSTLLMEAAGIDIAEALGLLTKDKPTEIRCAVADADIKAGTLQTRALVFDTRDTNLDGSLKIDLASEKIDGRLKAHPKDPSPLAARTPLKLGGTLSNPDFALDAGGLAARGGAAVVLGALLTPIAALIPMIELGLGKDSPCQELITAAREEDASAKAKAGSSAPQRAAPGMAKPRAARPVRPPAK